MEPKFTPEESKKPAEHSYDKEEWTKLSFVQKAQFLLNSGRLKDHDDFKKEFESWEEPRIGND